MVAHPSRLGKPRHPPYPPVPSHNLFARLRGRHVIRGSLTFFLKQTQHSNAILNLRIFLIFRILRNRDPAQAVKLIGRIHKSRSEFTKKTLLIGFRHTDYFRSLFPDRTGAYSWWSYRMAARSRNAGWRIDYFLLSDRLKGNLKDAFILDQVMGSDHCPVGVELEW